MEIIDGALATELEAKGCNLNHHLWSAKVLSESPDLIYAVHADYLRAGSDYVITASYQASVEGFAVVGIGREEAIGLIKKSA